jgi:hypothetical protein
MSTSVRTSRDPVSEHGRPMCDNNCRQLNGSFLLGVECCMLITGTRWQSDENTPAGSTDVLRWNIRG